MSRPNPYTRCKKCKELVTDAENCANCAAIAENPHRQNHPYILGGRRGAASLDMQEGNWEEWH